MDSSASSELSDIPEVEEDFHSEVSSRASTPKVRSPHTDDLPKVKVRMDYHSSIYRISVLSCFSPKMVVGLLLMFFVT